MLLRGEHLRSTFHTLCHGVDRTGLGSLDRGPSPTHIMELPVPPRTFSEWVRSKLPSTRAEWTVISDWQKCEDGWYEARIPFDWEHTRPPHLEVRTLAGVVNVDFSVDADGVVTLRQREPNPLHLRIT